MIGGRFLGTTLDGVVASLLRGTRTLADVKTKSCDDKYPAERSGLACAVVTKRQQEVNRKYHKKAGELDLEQGTAPDDTGPFRKELSEYGQKGRVIAPVVGAFAEMSLGTYAIADLISSVLQRHTDHIQRLRHAKQNCSLEISRALLMILHG